MIEMTTIYSLISITAIVAKLAIVWRGRQDIKTVDRWFLVFLVALFGINCLELVGFHYPASGHEAFLFMTLFYECLLVMGLSFLALALSATGVFKRAYKNAIVGTLVGVSIIFVVPGLFITGVESVGYTSTAIKGPLYWVFQLVFPLSLILSVVVLAFAQRFNPHELIQRKAKALLLSIIPIVVVAISIVCLMQMGVKITGSVFASLSIIMFVMIFMVTEDEHQLFRFLTYIPATSEYKLVNNLRSAIFTASKARLQEAVQQFEMAVISEAVVKHGGNKTLAASSLGISRTTLRRKMGATTDEE